MSLFGQERATILVENGEEPYPIQQSEHAPVMWVATLHAPALLNSTPRLEP